MLEINLSGKIALVTGASGQLGRVMAITMARCGADVAVHYRSNREIAQGVADEAASYGVRAIAVQADITDEASVTAMRDEVTQKLGAPDIIVLNAVSQYKWKPVLEQSPADYRDQFESIVMQCVLMSQAFVPAMVDKKWGRVVAINTECSAQCFPTFSAYAAGKRGLDGVVRTLAREVGEHGITVNQVAPGWTISDNDRKAGTEISEGYSANVPLKRRGTDQEIANAVAFFASDLAGFTTGVYLPVSGGTVMPGI